ILLLIFAPVHSLSAVTASANLAKKTALPSSIFFHTLCKLPVNLTAILALPFCSFSPTSITLPFSTSCNTMSRLLNVILPIETGYILPPALCYHFLPFYLSLQLEQYHLA